MRLPERVCTPLGSLVRMCTRLASPTVHAQASSVSKCCTYDARGLSQRLCTAYRGAHGTTGHNMAPQLQAPSGQHQIMQSL